MENGIDKKKSISLISDEIYELKNSKCNTVLKKKTLVSNAKKYVSEILKTCQNYDKEVKDFDKFLFRLFFLIKI